jgi:hypothetical protein
LSLRFMYIHCEHACRLTNGLTSLESGRPANYVLWIIASSRYRS